MIKEATNSFSDGIISDVNPINVPNTALTDCVNGTILTYNGNEYSLQNDMGNSKLKSVFLGDGFIPVGMKEYGGILYIVSYNPEKDLTEIGSYPSTKVGVKLENGDLLEKSISYINWSEKQNYSDLLKKYDLITFDTESNTDDYQINPGDELSLIKTETGDSAKYQKLNFYILDESNTLTNIDKYIKDYINLDEPNEVNWKIPGLLAYRLSFLSFDNFTTNFKLTKEPVYKSEESVSDVGFNLSYRFLMSDEFYKNSIEDPILVDVEIYKENEGEFEEIKTCTLTTNGQDFINIPNGQYYINTDSQDITLTEVKKETKIKIIATPRLGETIFDTYTSEYIYVADAFVFDDKSVSLGSSVWKYTVNDDGVSITMDSEGLDYVVDPEMYFTLERLSGGEFVKINKSENEELWKVEDFQQSSLVQNTFTIPFVEYTKEFNPKEDVVAEDLYRLSFVLKLADHKYNITKQKYVLASKLMNGFSEGNYDTITFEQWIANYKSCISGELKIKSATVKANETLDLYGDDLLRNLIDHPLFEKWPGFVKSTDTLSDQIVSIRQYYTLSNGKMDIDNFVLPHGPLWNDINKNIVIYSQIFDTQVFYDIDTYTGKLTQRKDFTTSKAYVCMEKTYKIYSTVKNQTLYDYDYDTRLETELTTDDFVTDTAYVYSDNYCAKTGAECAAWIKPLYKYLKTVSNNKDYGANIITTSKNIESKYKVQYQRENFITDHASIIRGGINKNIVPYRIINPFSENFFYRYDNNKIGKKKDFARLWCRKSTDYGTDLNRNENKPYYTLIAFKPESGNIFFLDLPNDIDSSAKSDEIDKAIIKLVNNISDNICRFYKKSSPIVCQFIKITPDSNIKSNTSLQVNNVFNAQYGFFGNPDILNKITNFVGYDHLGLKLTVDSDSTNIISETSFNFELIQSSVSDFDTYVENISKTFEESFAKVASDNFLKGKYVDKKVYFFKKNDLKTNVDTWNTLISVLNNENIKIGEVVKQYFNFSFIYKYYDSNTNSSIREEEKYQLVIDVGDCINSLTPISNAEFE